MLGCCGECWGVLGNNGVVLAVDVVDIGYQY